MTAQIAKSQKSNVVNYSPMTSEIEQLITWAKTACEEERARVGFDPDEDTLVPSWLPELEAAVEAVEMSQ